MSNHIAQTRPAKSEYNGGRELIPSRRHVFPMGSCYGCGSFIVYQLPKDSEIDSH